MPVETVLDVVLKTEGKLRSNIKQDACKWNPNTKAFNYWDGTDWVLATKDSLIIGSLVTSLFPLSDSRLHLLDGSVLTKKSYPDFWLYVSSQQSSSSSYFLSESAWQTWNTTYSQCPKFVLTSSSVRIPNFVNIQQNNEDLSDFVKYYIAVKER